MTLAEYQKKIIQLLLPHSDSARRDVELLLMHVLTKNRAQLFLDANENITSAQENQLQTLIKRRCNGEPIAYLLGTQPFWKMNLIVSRDTLIPRPETECVVEWIVHHFKNKKGLRVADLGTGSGAIAIALAIENPHWQIDATDLSPEALAIAKKNADQHHIKNIAFYSGDWCHALPEKTYDLIVSNPPYIAENDVHLKQLSFEPQQALVAGKKGLEAIEHITKQAKLFLKPSGSLVIEHGFDQVDAVNQIFKTAGFQHIQNHRDLSDTPRFVTGSI